MHSHDAAVAFHHDVSSIGGGFGYECDSIVGTGGQWRIAADELADGFGAGSGFSPTASCEDKPVVPVAFWDELIGSAEDLPLIAEVGEVFFRQSGEDFILLVRGQRCQIGC